MSNKLIFEVPKGVMAGIDGPYRLMTHHSKSNGFSADATLCLVDARGTLRSWRRYPDDFEASQAFTDLACEMEVSAKGKKKDSLFDFSLASFNRNFSFLSEEQKGLNCCWNIYAIKEGRVIKAILHYIPSPKGGTRREGRLKIEFPCLLSYHLDFGCAEDAFFEAAILQENYGTLSDSFVPFDVAASSFRMVQTIR